ETEEVLMKIIIEGSAEEIFDFVGEIQSRILNSYASADGINLYEAVQQFACEGSKTAVPLFTSDSLSSNEEILNIIHQCRNVKESILNENHQ
ncbi:MAG: hypothetical protein IJN43_14830, partial [Ruminococcus sp.]|nr:hypothetical protein [Ruminococcus sp.]